MAGYVIIDSEVTGEAVFAEFFERVPASVDAYGGNYLVRGGATEVMEGDWTGPSRRGRYRAPPLTDPSVRVYALGSSHVSFAHGA